MDRDKKFMKRAIELAKKGEGSTRPNPLVGAVIVKNGEIIGEGYHQYYGENHAEIEAINSSKESVVGATLYVNLEPCSHYGKTPPCANRIVEEGFSKVVIGMMDPNPKVAGKGIGILKKNNIEVVVGVLENEAKQLNEIFIKYITENRPFTYLKYGMTLDGKIATTTGDSKWITNDKSRQEVHKIRNKVGAIMVGIGTILADDPSLNTRIKNISGKCHDPIRIIVDSECRIPPTAKVLHLNSQSKTIVAVTKKADPLKIGEVLATGAEVLIVDQKDERVNLNSLIKILGEKGIDSILIEGGSELSYSVLAESLIDKVMAFISPKIIGGARAPTPVGGKGINLIKDAIELKKVKRKVYGQDIMIEGYIKKRGD
ncbi:MAG: bifunctional diaminohydroxyphosphoribosylaminopyrimidine deaminase/5-amino-6-(5-phosphoribosylamino)uracil reductase RibD [Firmicutes bacterium]|nr:bifunctional diaminohydroxyphosphoribosylaminopyrimidine deaminase/5-amino-6-(5-phosphoribosylamino)uracil reductase RibD [Bacillota bacterium]